MKAPYLIQRCEIKRPLGDYRGKRFSQAVSLDYMGSAEFEFGAVPKSLRAMSEHGCTLYTVPSITQNDVSLKVLCCFDEGELAEYSKYLLRMRNEKLGRLHTKESVRFDPSYSDDTDLWWDIENHVMWSFDKAFMNGLQANLAVSLEYMNTQAKASLPGPRHGLGSHE